jgi:hypothetical protein
MHQPMIRALALEMAVERCELGLGLAAARGQIAVVLAHRHLSKIRLGHRAGTRST